MRSLERQTPPRIRLPFSLFPRLAGLCARAPEAQTAGPTMLFPKTGDDGEGADRGTEFVFTFLSTKLNKFQTSHRSKTDQRLFHTICLCVRYFIEFLYKSLSLWQQIGKIVLSHILLPCRIYKVDWACWRHMWSSNSPVVLSRILHSWGFSTPLVHGKTAAFQYVNIRGKRKHSDKRSFLFFSSRKNSKPFLELNSEVFGIGIRNNTYNTRLFCLYLISPTSSEAT